MDLSFNPRQRAILKTAITGLALLTLCFLITATFLGIVEFLAKFSLVFLPLATAGILSLLLRPVYQFLRRKWHFPPIAAVSLILFLFLLPLFIIFGVFGGLIISQLNEFFRNIPETWENLQVWLNEKAPALNTYIEKIDGWGKMQELLDERSSSFVAIAAAGGQGVLNVAGNLMGFFSWVVLPVYLIFMLIAPPFRLDKLAEFLPFMNKDHREDVLFLIHQFVDIVVAFFKGQLIIAFAQAIMMAIGFTLIGLPYGFILGLVLGLLNMIPYLGNIIGMLVTLPLAWFSEDGGLGMLIGVLVTLGVVQFVESYILTPRIMGNKTGLHPMAVIFSMFFWGTAFGGIFGLILAIPLTAFLVVFWRLAREKYIPKIKEATPE